MLRAIRYTSREFSHAPNVEFVTRSFRSFACLSELIGFIECVRELLDCKPSVFLESISPRAQGTGRQNDDFRGG